jgi:hypothetical protein
MPVWLSLVTSTFGERFWFGLGNIWPTVYTSAIFCCLPLVSRQHTAVTTSIFTNLHKESKPTCCTILFFLFLVRFPTCFGQIYWHSSGILMQRCFNVELLVWMQMLGLQLLKLLESGSG